MDDLHHPLDLLGRDRSGATLFPQEVHYVRGELIAGLKRITKTTVRISLCMLLGGNASNIEKTTSIYETR